jgi:regulatory protein
MKMDTTARMVMKKLQQICSKQEKCRTEIQDYLTRHDVSPEFQQSIISQLKAEKYFDEERYARAAAKDKFQLNRWGRIKIRYFLRSKQIPHEIITRAIESIDETDYHQILQQELSKKARTLKSADPEVQKMKLLQFAASRGYEEEITWKLLKALEI